MTAHRRAQLAIRSAQLLLLTAALGLWVASRLPWVVVRSFDGLGQPKTVTLTGAAWSTALVPLAVALLAAAIAALAVRGWPLRLLAILLGGSSLAIGYLGRSFWAIRDVGVRASALAQVPVTNLVGAERHYWGAAVMLATAVCTLLAAALLMRGAAIRSSGSTKYAAPAARRAAAAESGPGGADSERMIWDALDEGRDLTLDVGVLPQTKSDTEGR